MAASSSGNVSQPNMRRGGPRVSVGVPVFNGESVLAETLQSLLNQTFSDFEIVVSDNASTDRTEEICRAYADRDARIRYSRNDVNRGAAWNHNRVFELATGEFFKWNSADDLCAPQFLARCVAALDEDPAAVMAMTQSDEINEYGKPLESKTVPSHSLLPALQPNAPAHIRFRQNIRLDHLCLGIYSLIRSDILRQAGPMGNYNDADRDVLARLALLGHCVVLPETLFFNRDHAGRFSRSHNRQYYAWSERSSWWDPSNAQRKEFPTWRKLLELRRAVSCAPLSWQERRRCYWEIIRWVQNKAVMRLLYADATHYPRKWLVRHFPGAKVAWNWLWGERNVVRQKTEPGDTIRRGY